MWIALLFLFGSICYALEFTRPVVPRPPVRSWVWRVWGLNLLQLPLVGAVAATWHAFADRASLLHLSDAVAPCVAGVLGYLAYTFVFYWWHRARHRSDFVWRTLHQIHHSPRRLELVTAFYKHPLETLVNALLAAALFFPLLGLDVQAAIVATGLAGLADLFYHANMRTPRWIGWIVQRPEMHRLHHEAERHDGNYGDLPIWDRLFGTLRLPDDAPVACGFEAGREEKLLAMMCFDDVHATSPCGSEVSGPRMRDAAALDTTGPR